MAQTSFSGPVLLGAFTVATVPYTSGNTPIKTGSVCYVADGAAGDPVLAFFDGTDWLRCDTLAAISAAP